MSPRPVAEVVVSEGLVSRLLAKQYPNLSGLTLRLVDAGWDNVVYRLGDTLAVRLPRRAAAVNLLVHEQAWLPEIAARVEVPVPVPLHRGVPSAAFPWGWSVVPWIEGQSADATPLAPPQASAVGVFLKSLHQPVPEGYPWNPYRSVPLSQKNELVQRRFSRLTNELGRDAAILRQAWDEAVAAPVDVAPATLRGDLHPQNVLSRDGTLAGVIDWGDLGQGDVATDLAAAWMLFPRPEERDNLFSAYGSVSLVTRCRALGWALFFGLAFLDVGLGGQDRDLVLGRAILQTVKDSSG